MRIAIISGVAFIGLQLVEQLAPEHDLLVIHRGNAQARLQALLSPRLQELSSTKADLAQHKEIIKVFEPEVVLDMVAMTEEDSQQTVAAFKGIASRLVAVSSCDVYRAFDKLRGKQDGEPDATPLKEDAPLRDKLYPYRDGTADPKSWLNQYDKILVERLLMSEPNLPATILRLPMVYGLQDRQHRLYPYLKRMLNRRSAIVLQPGEGQWRNTRGYVENIAAAIKLAILNPASAGKIYNVAESEGLTEREWVERIAKQVGWEGRIIEAPIEHKLEDDQTNYNQPLVIDSERIRQELGYAEPVDFETGLRLTIEWETSNPPTVLDPKAYDYDYEDRILKEA